MYGYISGEIKEIEPSYVIIDNNGIGYLIYVPNPYGFMIGKNYTIYTYTKVAEDEYSLYGFKTKEEKELFLRLINVKGLGPKMALPMLATGSVSGIIDAIDRENVLYLTKFPKIGEKIARQIILDLKGKLAANLQDENNSTNDELIDVLTSLGYKNSDIKKVIKSIDSSLPIELQVKEALKLLLK